LPPSCWWDGGGVTMKMHVVWATLSLVMVVAALLHG
jgi:hypothetical protein